MDAQAHGHASDPAGEPRPAGDATAAWSARYREYLERSLARAGRAHGLNRELTRRVAAGELAPWTLESSLTTFAATRGAAYAQRIAKITMAFLVGMIETGSAYSGELVQAVLPGAVPDSKPTTPGFDPATSLDWFGDLTRFAATENARITGMLRALMEEVAAGKLTPAAAEEASSAFHTEHLPGSTSHLVELYLDLLTGLEEVHASYSEAYLRSVLGEIAGEPVADAPAVEIGAVQGEAASVRFAVANTDLEPAIVACTLSGVRRGDGIGPAFDPMAQMTPERLELAPGAEATVELAIQADADHFQPGVSYDGVFRVASATRTLLELPLRIRVTAPPPTAPQPPAPAP